MQKAVRTLRRAVRGLHNVASALQSVLRQKLAYGNRDRSLLVGKPQKFSLQIGVGLDPGFGDQAVVETALMTRPPILHAQDLAGG